MILKLSKCQNNQSLNFENLSKFQRKNTTLLIPNTLKNSLTKLPKISIQFRGNSTGKLKTRANFMKTPIFLNPEFQKLIDQLSILKNQAKEIIEMRKISIEERKILLMKKCYELICLIYKNKEFGNIEIYGMELLGDILVEFRDFQSAILYFWKAVFLSIIS